MTWAFMEGPLARGLWTVPALSPYFSIRAAGFYYKVGRAARFIFCVPSLLSSSAPRHLVLSAVLSAALGPNFAA